MEQEPIAKLKTYFPPTLALTQPQSHTQANSYERTWEAMDSTKVVLGEWVLCKTSRTSEEEKQQMKVELQQQGQFHRKDQA